MKEKRFAPRGENVLRLAQEAAAELGHGYVGCEHILLGILRDGGVAERALGEAGVTERMVRDLIVRAVGRGMATGDEELTLTPRARSAMEIAVNEANRAGDLIDAEHILLGILRDGGNMAVRILATAGVDPRQLYNNIRRLIAIGSYRGTRHRKNLPVRGQRTRTNARTRKGSKKTVGAIRDRTERKTAASAAAAKLEGKPAAKK